MTRSLENNEKGFTIIELLVALAISLIIIGVAIKMFVIQQDALSYQEDLTEMEQNIRTAIEMIVREARMAGYNPTVIADFEGLPYNATELRILADIDNDGTITPGIEDVPEDITYSLGTDTIVRNIGNGDEVIVDNIQAFTFAYLNDNDIATTTTSEVRAISISVTGRTSNTHNGSYRYGTLTSRITPENLGP